MGSIVWRVPTVIGPPVSAATNRGEFGGTRLLVSDLRTTWLLLAEAYYRALARVFGVRRDQTKMVTLIGAALVARAARERASRATQSVARPSLEDAALGSGLVKEGLHMIAGPDSRDVPLGSLIAIVLATKFSRPVVRYSAHAMRSGSHLLHDTFAHRYGHVVGRNGRGAYLSQTSPERNA